MSSVWGAEEVRFPIRAYQLDGAARIPGEALAAALAPYTGNDQSFASIQQAVATVQRLYVDAGYSTVQVTIPQQDISQGTVQLTIVEAALGQVEVTGNQHFDTDNIRASLPALKEGDVPNAAAIGLGIRLANESYAKQTQLTFRQGSRPDTVDAIVRVADDDPVRQAITLDNTGTAKTGNYRIGYAFQHANLFNQDHTFTAQYVTSPDHISDVTILGANYHIPLYRYGGALDISVSHSNVNSGLVNTTAGSYSISGSGDVLGFKYTQLLPRWGGWDQRLSLGFDYKAFHNGVTPTGASASLIPDLVAHPLTLTYAAFSKEDSREWGGNINFSQNLPGGDKGTSAAYRAPGARAEATASYQIWRYALYLNQPLPQDWILKAQVNGQVTNNALITGEQFGIGGAESVRGFHERAVINDQGYRASLELHTFDFGKDANLGDFHARGVAFYDTGEVWRNRPLSAETRHNQISSAGFGLRLAYGPKTQMRIDYASIQQSGGIPSADHRLLQASLTVLF